MRRKSNSGRLMMMGSEGSIAVMVAIAMVVLLGAASLAIDVGHLATVPPSEAARCATSS